MGLQVSAVDLHQFLWGALTMAAGIAGLIFLRSWKLTRDRLFLFFCLAFWVFALSWLALATVSMESRLFIYLLRLSGFALIIVAIIDKNRHRGKP
jgi:hypothetical protein